MRNKDNFFHHPNKYKHKICKLKKNIQYKKDRLLDKI